MSTIYFQQPPTSGKVILVTNFGEIEIELWAKETPKACRNFIQLCLEGYYDNTIFHRLIKGQIIQGGDPTGTGRGGESIYGKPFTDEFHTRLKFSHRGIVAMANSNKPNDNGSQFFMTFDKCPWLDKEKKNTIFGKVVGDTMYNFLQLNDLEVGSNDKPINPPVIQTTKVIINPFDDIVVRNTPKVIAKQKEKEAEQQSKLQKKNQQESQNKKQNLEQKKKGVKNKNLLSFMADMDEDESEEESEKKQNQKKVKILSSHDALNDKYLKKQEAISLEELAKKKQLEEQEQQMKQQLKDKIINQDFTQDPNQKQNRKDKLKELAKNSKIDAELLEKEGLENYKYKYNKKTNKMEIVFEKPEKKEGDEEDNAIDEESDSEQYLTEEQKKMRQAKKDEYEKLKIECLQFKMNKIGTNNTDFKESQYQESKLLSNVEKQRQKYLNKKRIKEHNDDVIKRLNAYKSMINSEDVKNNQKHWMNTEGLHFQIDGTRAYADAALRDKMDERIKNQRLQEQLVVEQEHNDEEYKKHITTDDLIKMTENV